MHRPPTPQVGETTHPMVEILEKISGGETKEEVGENSTKVQVHPEPLHLPPHRLPGKPFFTGRHYLEPLVPSFPLCPSLHRNSWLEICWGPQCSRTCPACPPLSSSPGRRTSWSSQPRHRRLQVASRSLADHRQLLESSSAVTQILLHSCYENKQCLIQQPS